MLEHQESRRNESDKPADGRRGRPGERRSARPSYANGERRAVPRPNRHRARAGGFVADMNPDVVYIGWQLGKEKGRSGPDRLPLNGRRFRTYELDLDLRAGHKLLVGNDVPGRFPRDAAETRSASAEVVPSQVDAVVEPGDEVFEGGGICAASLETHAEGGVCRGPAQIRGATNVNRTHPGPVRQSPEGVPGRKQAGAIVEDEGVTEPDVCEAGISTQLNRCREAAPVIAGGRDERREGAATTIPVAAGPAD